MFIWGMLRVILFVRINKMCSLIFCFFCAEKTRFVIVNEKATFYVSRLNMIVLIFTMVFSCEIQAFEIYKVSKNGDVFLNNRDECSNFFSELERCADSDESSEDKEYFRRVVDKTVMLESRCHCVEDLPAEIGLLKNLQEMNFYCRFITSLPPEIGKLKNLRRLVLCCQNLFCIPPEIGQLKNLEYLYLQSNSLSSLPPEIGELENLKELRISTCGVTYCADTVESRLPKMTTLPSEIGKLKKLERLYLDQYDIGTLPPEFVKLDNLKSLTFQSCNLVSIPSPALQLVNLEYFHLWGNEIGFLQPEIGNLTKLKHLYIPHNKLTILPKEIENLPELERLYLSDNKLTSLPGEIGKLTKLTSMNLEHNKLTTLPKEIGKLTKLTFLNLNNNELEEIPKEIGTLRGLCQLGLNGNEELEDLPLEIAQLERLELLGFDFRLFYKCFRQIDYYRENSGYCYTPHWLDVPGALEFTSPFEFDKISLRLGYDDSFKEQIMGKAKQGLLFSGQFEGVPEPDICLRNHMSTISGLCNNELWTLEFTSKEQLTIFEVRFELDLDFRKMAKKIQILVLNGLELKTIPEFVYELDNLERLFLERNCISMIPRAIGNLHQLDFLSLGENEICEFPNSIGTLTNLVGITLNNNRLREIPLFFGQLEKLETILLDENLIYNIDELLQHLINDVKSLKFLSADCEALERFYQQCESDESKIRFKKLTWL